MMARPYEAQWFTEDNIHTSHEERTIVMEYTMGLPTPKFADLLIRLREEGRGVGRGVSAEHGAEGLPGGRR